MQSQTVFCVSDEKADAERLTLSSNMSERRGKTPLYQGFGAYLRTLRAAYGVRLNKPVSLDQVSRELSLRGFPAQKAKLSEWERGVVEKPDPGVLIGLAEIYGVTYEDLFRVLLHDKLARAAHPPDIALRFLSGGTTEAPDAEDQDGRQQHESPMPITGYSAYEAAARLTDVADELAALADAILHAAFGGQTPAPRRPSASRDESHRKTRRRAAS